MHLEGVPVEITVALPTTGSGASPERIRTVAVEAESRGWPTVWTVERLVFPDPTVPGATHASDHYRVAFDPLDSIAWAAAHTSRLRFGTSILNALFHPPVVLARRLATIDRLSEGRLVVGLGQGWMPEEFEVAGVPMSRRGNGFEEYLAALTSVWGPDPVSYAGRFYRIPRSYLAPKPSQAGGPPVLIGAVAPATAARAGRLGYGLNLVMVTWDHFEELLGAWRKARAAAGYDTVAPVVVRTNTVVGSETNEIGEVAGRGKKAGADLRRLADYDIDEVFFETGRGPMPIAEQLDLVDAWRSELSA
jgi:probable F420-dependent oxidoreductase